MDIEKHEWLRNRSRHALRSNEFVFINQLGWRSNGEPMWTKPIEESIVLVGCSQTYAGTLPYKDTFAYHLEQSLDRQVINLGRPMGSPEWIWKMLVDIKQNAKPWAIVINWPSPFRYYEWHTDRFGVLTFDVLQRDQALYRFYLEHPEFLQKYNDYIIKSSRLMWQEHTRLVEMTWSIDLSDQTHMIHQADSVSTQDKHWGVKTNKLAASYIIDQLSRKV